MSRRLYGNSQAVKCVLDAYQTILMVKAEAVEALLYGCVTWTTRQEH